MRILGINRTCEASISIFEDGRHLVSIQKERLSKVKHDNGSIGDISTYAENVYEFGSPFDVIVESYSSDTERSNRDEYVRELQSHHLTHEGTKFLEISHHQSHLYSALPHISTNTYGVIVADSIGSKITSELTEEYPGLKEDIGEFEICSYYIVRDGVPACIAKQTTSLENRDNNGIGRFYSNLRNAIFPGQGNEGKVMGLAAFGDRSRYDSFPKLQFNNGCVSVPSKTLSLLKEYKVKNECGQLSFQEKADLAAFGQYLFELAYSQMVEWLLQKTGTQNIALVGGCALNCVSNGKLISEFKDINIYVPPAPNDAGTSLGAAVYGVQKMGDTLDFKWENDYLGPTYSTADDDLLAVLHESSVKYSKPLDLASETAKLLVEGNVVGLFQGRSEFGPRALGNRSILSDSRYESSKYYINLLVKGREWFRPIAPMVLEEDLDKYFITQRQKSFPFMLHTLPLVHEKSSQICAAEHPDNCMRVQTVTRDCNELVYDILRMVKEYTGNSTITNTSFNGPGETMVETLEQAINCFQSNNMHYLIVPPYILKSKKELKLTTSL